MEHSSNEPRIVETERENAAAEHREGEARRHGMGTAAMIAIAVLAVVNAYLLWGMHELKTSVGNLEQRYTSEVAVMQETASLEAGKSQREMEALRTELEAAQKEAATAVGNAKVEAKKHAERLAQKLAAEQKKEAELLATELTAVREQTDTKFEEVTSNADDVQRRVLEEILSRNADVEYLKRHGLQGRTDRESFKHVMPVVTYEDIQPDINRISNGDKSQILCSSPISEFLTRFVINILSYSSSSRCSVFALFLLCFFKSLARFLYAL